MTDIAAKIDSSFAANRDKRLDQSFRTFLSELEARGELIRFKKPVHPVQNMSAVEWKTYNELGKSSLFTNIEGHPGWTACSQIVADRRKWAIGLGIEEDGLLQEISRRLKNPIASTAHEGDAPVKEMRLIGDAADLNDLPAAKVSERDSGRYIPSGITFVKDPDTGVGNLSLHRQQINGRDRTGFVNASAPRPAHLRQIFTARPAHACGRGHRGPSGHLVVSGVQHRPGDR